MNERIRLAVVSDYDKLLNLFKEVHQLHVCHLGEYFKDVENPMPQNYYYLLLDDVNTYFLLIENDNDIIGFAIMVIKDTQNYDIIVERKYAYIDDFVISFKYQRRGYGKQLFSECLRIAKENKVTSLELNVWEFNQDAISFYENLNMKTLNRKMSLKL
ncbi:GNAT family N-acetyltransferase [Mycoplasmatota bacterium]|nr:GNAT family N-acetyltransferase [Mycoplasmatota bacterium]